VRAVGEHIVALGEQLFRIPSPVSGIKILKVISLNAEDNTYGAITAMVDLVREDEQEAFRAALDTVGFRQLMVTASEITAMLNVEMEEGGGGG